MIRTLKVYIKRFTLGKKGQGTVEYGFILFLIALGVVVVLKTMGEKVAQLLSSVTF